ncbi:MAG: universal stress protein, partial [Actinomycetota bacterium]|nr:universal stress protein [Actinomycetota bacterium]
MAELVDIYELSRRVQGIGAACTTTVLHDNDVAGALLSFLVERPQALVAMATRARGVLGEHLLGGVTESLLARADRPILMVGPSARITDPLPSPTLVAGVNATTTSEAVLPALAAWIGSFGGPPPWLVEVLPARREAQRLGEIGESDHVQMLATRLNEHGIKAKWEVAHARHPETVLIEFADRLVDAVLVVASVRWTDPEHSHLASVARRLAHRAHHPVLVVPA